MKRMDQIIVGNVGVDVIGRELKEVGVEQLIQRPEIFLPTIE